MKKQRSDAINTRQSLLEAAGEVFAKKGFWSATHEEICSRANANLAAINYHFGSKENLYVEAWKHSYEKSNAKQNLDEISRAQKRERPRIFPFSSTPFPSFNRFCSPFSNIDTLVSGLDRPFLSPTNQ